MRVIARSTLLHFVDTLRGHKDQGAVKAALDSWFHEVRKAHWANSADARQQYTAASVVSADRIVCNIKGNDYRLVVAVKFDIEVVWINWVGTHEDYDHIDVMEVEYE